MPLTETNETVPPCLTEPQRCVARLIGQALAARWARAKSSAHAEVAEAVLESERSLLLPSIPDTQA